MKELHLACLVRKGSYTIGTYYTYIYVLDTYACDSLVTYMFGHVPVGCPLPPIACSRWTDSISGRRYRMLSPSDQLLRYPPSIAFSKTRKVSLHTVVFEGWAARVIVVLSVPNITRGLSLFLVSSCPSRSSRCFAFSCSLLMLFLSWVSNLVPVRINPGGKVIRFLI